MIYNRTSYENGWLNGGSPMTQESSKSLNWVAKIYRVGGCYWLQCSVLLCFSWGCSKVLVNQIWISRMPDSARWWHVLVGVTLVSGLYWPVLWSANLHIYDTLIHLTWHAMTTIIPLLGPVARNNAYTNLLNLEVRSHKGWETKSPPRNRNIMITLYPWLAKAKSIMDLDALPLKTLHS